MGPTERVINLYRELASRRHPVSVRELAEVLECSDRNTKKIIEKLRDYGAPIVYDREYNGYTLEKNSSQFEMPGVWFSSSELHALLTSYQLLSNVQPGWLDDYIKPLKERIEKLLDNDTRDFDEIQKRVRILQIAARPTDLEKFQRVSEALIKRHQLKILYHARTSDETSERTVSPQRLIYYRNNWYLDAWCHLRNGLRSFSIDRLHPIEILHEPAKPITDSELDEHYAQAYGIFAGPAISTAHLLFSGQVAKWVADESWHAEEQGTVRTDGRYELKIPYGDPTELIMDILKYGPEVEVLGPPELREAVAKRLQQAVDLYSKA